MKIPDKLKALGDIALLPGRTRDFRNGTQRAAEVRRLTLKNTQPHKRQFQQGAAQS